LLTQPWRRASSITFREEQVGDLVREQPRLVLAVGRRIEHLRLERQIHEPAKEHIGLQPRAELAFTAHRVERLQHFALEQCFRRNRWCSVLGIDLVEVTAHLLQRFVAQPLDWPDRMIGGDQRLDVDQAHEARLGGNLSAHAFPTIRYSPTFRTFSAAC
jgi:hypothetical protein